jgi:hypothetical protein
VDQVRQLQENYVSLSFFLSNPDSNQIKFKFVKKLNLKKGNFGWQIPST